MYLLKLGFQKIQVTPWMDDRKFKILTQLTEGCQALKKLKIKLMTLIEIKALLQNAFIFL